MGNVEDIRKALEDLVAPSLAELKTEVKRLQSDVSEIRADAREFRSEARSELVAMETRVLKAIESAKAEVLLVVRVSDLSARNAELEAKLAEIARRDSQHQ